jgi:hypothetical protein
MQLSPEVQKFAEHMQREIDANAHKGDWHEFMDSDGILSEIEWHKAKLLFALKDANKDRITEHAADCANFFMMLLHNEQCL